jgi:hypothetical protein
MPMCHRGKSVDVSEGHSGNTCVLTPDTNTKRGEDGPEDKLILGQWSSLPTVDVTYAIIDISGCVNGL